MLTVAQFRDILCQKYVHGEICRYVQTLQIEWKRDMQPKALYNSQVRVINSEADDQIVNRV